MIEKYLPFNITLISFYVMVDSSRNKVRIHSLLKIVHF